MKNSPIQLTNATLQLVEDDVIVIKYKAGVTISVKDAEEVMKARKALIGDTKYYPIVDFTEGIVKFSEPVKAWMSVNKEAYSMRYLDIALVKNVWMKIKIKTYLSLFKPVNKTIVVSSMEQAMSIIANDRKMESNS